MNQFFKFTQVKLRAETNIAHIKFTKSIIEFSSQKQFNLIPKCFAITYRYTRAELNSKFHTLSKLFSFSASIRRSVANSTSRTCQHGGTSGRGRTR